MPRFTLVALALFLSSAALAQTPVGGVSIRPAAPEDVVYEASSPENMMEFLEAQGLDASAEELEARLDDLTPEQRAALAASGMDLVGQTTIGDASETTVLFDAPAIVASGDLATYTVRQTYTPLEDGYGRPGDGFPRQSQVRGTVVAVGSQRLCRANRPTVSRWVHVRLAGTAAPRYVVVAIQCDEERESHYLGRSVSIRAWKSDPSDPIRMARANLPASDAPIYQAYRTDVIVW